MAAIKREERMMTTTTTTRTPDEIRLGTYIAHKAFQLMERSNIFYEQPRTDEDAPYVYTWLCEERVVLIVDPLQVKNINAINSPRFLHHLSTTLDGRTVHLTNHKGLFLQIAYYPEPVVELHSKSLDLSEQKTPWHVPIGMTTKGNLWLSLVEMDAVLIGGARRMGKTNLLHGWIAALLQGKETRLVLFDGKDGAEFAKYEGQTLGQVVRGPLGPALGELVNEMTQRFELLRQAKAPNLAEYNQAHSTGGRLSRIVLIVDELAFALQEKVAEDLLVDLIARGGAVGIHPVLATQRPSSDVVTPKIKSNLVTRIALPVPDRASSQVILDRGGAETLPKVPGRLMIANSARMIQAQAFVSSGQWIVGSGQPNSPLTTAPSPLFSVRERRLARAAIEAGGWFKTEEIKERAGERDNGYVNGVAKKWELLGYLTPVLRNERGHQLGRQVTDRLRAALTHESGEPSNQVNQGE
jgi:hypothetical protein